MSVNFLEKAPEAITVFSNLYSSFSDIDQDTLITSSYISSVVVPEGGGIYQFTPTSNIALSSSFLRGTGGITLDITI